MGPGTNLSPAAPDPAPLATDRDDGPPHPSGPALSVLIAQFQPRGYLRDAVASVRTEADRLPAGTIEILVVLAADDPSIEPELRSAGPRVRLLRADEPRIGRMLASGIRASAGEAIAFLDDDDRFRPGKLARTLELFAQDPELDFWHHEIELIDARGARIERSLFRAQVRSRMRPGVSVRLAPGSKRTGLGRLAGVGPDFNSSSMVVRRRAILPFVGDLDAIVAGPDAFLFVTAGLLGSGAIRCDGDRWTEYRLHAKSASQPVVESPDPRPKLEASSLRQAAAQSGLAGIAAAHGNPGVAREADAMVASHRFFAVLRSPRPTRRAWAVGWLTAARYWPTFVFRTNAVAFFGSALWILSPRWAQAAYLKAAGAI